MSLYIGTALLLLVAVGTFHQRGNRPQISFCTCTSLCRWKKHDLYSTIGNQFFSHTLDLFIFGIRGFSNTSLSVKTMYLLFLVITHSTSIFRSMKVFLNYLVQARPKTNSSDTICGKLAWLHACWFLIKSWIAIMLV